MKIEQLYTGCLAQGAYYIESDGEAAIIDPLREIQPYIDMAKQRGAKIRYIFETHFHADFVSGHVDLARATGAAIIYGPTNMETGFTATIGHDGQEFPLGKARIRLIHTPGHTLESSCFLLIDEEGNPHALFTGDTLFIGDVGRPDLAQHVIAELSPKILASHLYDSLRNKIMPLPDSIIIYPAHGAGSACGKNMSEETTDTLGHQKRTNYALQPELTRAEFIEQVLAGLTPPPGYFPKNVLLNIKGYEPIDEVLDRGKKALDPDAFEWIASDHNTLILDTRNATAFGKGFIPGSINIGIDGNLAVWAGTLIPDIQQDILIVADPGREQEVITRLARVGYDHVVGFLQGGFDAWKQHGKTVDSIPSISAEALVLLLKSAPSTRVLDVRKQSEYESEHLVDAINVPLDYINEYMHTIDPASTYYVHCAGGYRSMTFISILQARGYRHLVNVAGGFNALKRTGKVSLSQYVQPVTML
jgi:hydroxyacylglutathione hydrolase